MLFPRKTLGLAILLVSCLLVTPALADSVSLEQTISARYSARSWTSDSISEAQLLEVLRSAYGVYGDHRSVPQVGNAYSLDLFVVNATGTYRYIPEQNMLTVYSLDVNKETLRPSLGQSYVANANAVIIIIWNQTRMSNQYCASAEAGLVVQNVYLAAVMLNLGTVCIGGINSNNLRSALSLPATMTPLLTMPLGYPTSPYSSATPDYTRMTGNLPPVQISQTSFTDALNNMFYAQSWSSQSVSTQELSQLLWAAYGYSSTDHRTVPSAMDVYPMKIWFLNATAAYEFNPQTHSVTLKLEGDKRLEIADALGSPNLANVTTVFLVIYNSSPGNDGGGAVSHEWPEVEAGAIAQNILLEATAWGLSGNIISQGLEEWNGAGAASIRSILGLSSSLIPLCAVPVGHGIIPEFSSPIIITTFMVATAIATAFYLIRSRRTPKGMQMRRKL